MTGHPALAAGRVAVITGAASGIGLAAAMRFAAMGLRVCLADLSAQALEQAADKVAAAAPTGRSAVISVPTDVSSIDAITAAFYGPHRISPRTGPRCRDGILTTVRRLTGFWRKNVMRVR